MLKRFFTVFLGSMAAIWFSIVLFIVLAAVGVVAILVNNKNEIKKNSVLYIDLYGQIDERRHTLTSRDLMSGFDRNIPTLNEIIEAVRLANVDPKIKGIYLNLHGASMGLAMREELRDELKNFKESGKWIVAYADSYTQGDYYTASIADEIYINPQGQLAANGLSASVPYFKNALDKLGVEIQVLKVGTFKSAVEPFILTEMSDSARMMYDTMLGAMWNSYISDITTDLNWNEGNNPDSVFRAMAAKPMTSFTATELVKKDLFTAVKYQYQVEDIVKAKISAKDNSNFVTIREYLAKVNGSSQNLFNTSSTKDHIAVIYAVGDIVDSGSLSDAIVGDKMSAMIINMADKDDIKGLVLRVNSGGGSAFASEQIWASLEYFKSKGKPFAVSMSDAAASGGYYISCGADKIFADPATITGSIGIFGIIPCAEKLLNDKLGVNFSVVETNPNAAFPVLDRPLTEDQRESLDKMIKDGYNLFIKRVAEGRKMDEAKVRRIAEGRVWAGVTAKEIGLVDELGSLSDAVAYVAEKANISKTEYVEYPKIDTSALDFIMSLEDSSDPMMAQMPAYEMMNTIGMTPEQIKQTTSILTRMRSMNTVQAKMEDISVRP